MPDATLARLSGYTAVKCSTRRSDKAVTPHPTSNAKPVPDATLARLIRPTPL
ncbi:hypothetical protein ACVXG9_08865 [Escherichia coli]